MAVEFEWDAAKAKANLEKHGVAFDEALTVLADRLARIFDDPDHSADEIRELVIGHSARNRVFVVSFTERDGRVRIINARRATRRERSNHEKNTKGAKQRS